jgi:tRNA-Thr(GGU) m(6)t(6)A37 methyltransferase TsaA
MAHEMKTIDKASLPMSEIRPGEIAVPPPETGDALVYFIGRIRTPWKLRSDCPKRGDPIEGPICTLEIEERWREALAGVDGHEWLQLLYWMDLARRDLVRQSPKSDGLTTGTFALRSPVRPNPIASSIVHLVRVEGLNLFVRGLDCVDGTPLIDIKPEHCPHEISASGK